VTAGFLLVFLVFGEALLSLLVGYRAGKAVDIEMLWLIMLGLGGVFVCGAMGSVTASSFYARGDTRLPTRVGALTFTIYIPIKVLSFHYGGAIALRSRQVSIIWSILYFSWHTSKKLIRSCR
jgi:peptidoglycan biosynthesis protein MviN/MurJ (putative lipid II flippase)